MSDEKTKILKLLQDFSFVREQDTLIARCDHAPHDLSEIKEGLKSAGYKYFDNAVDESDGKVTITLLMTSNVWTRGEPNIFLSIQDLWGFCTSSGSVPNIYVIPEEDLEDSKEVCAVFRSFLKVKRLVKEVSDYVTEADAALLFYNSKDSIKKEEISLVISLSDIKIFRVSEDREKSIDSLIKFFDIDEDAHSHERNNVLKNVVIEFLDNNGRKDFLPSVYNSIDVLLKRYKEQYKLYVDRFSVNKVLNDISEKHLEYSSKVNEFISSGQTKAFAIPGAIIAIGTIVRAQPTFLASILIFVGLLLVNFFVKSANQVYLESYKHLQRQVDYTFDRFKELDSSTEVSLLAEDSKKSILDRIDRAEERLSDIDFFSSVIPWLGGVYLIGSFIVSSYS